jgi:hypothetical protein
LRAIWARPWADDDAADRRAFAQACQEAAPEIIIAAAAAFVAAADAPRFLPPLAKWLAAHGWEKPPPTKRGPARANGKARNGYAKPDMFKICLKEGGYREDPETGEMYWPADNPNNSGAGEDDEPISTSMWGGGK